MRKDKGVIEQIIENKEEIIVKMLSVLGGQEASARVNLDGVQFKIGEAAIKLNGQIEFTLIPPKKK